MNLPKVGDKIEMKRSQQTKIRRWARKQAKTDHSSISERQAEAVDSTGGIFTVKIVKNNGVIYVEEQPWSWHIDMFKEF